MHKFHISRIHAICCKTKCYLHLVIIIRVQSKIVRQISDAPWFISSKTLSNDLNIEFIDRVIKLSSVQHCLIQKNHTNFIVN